MQANSLKGDAGIPKTPPAPAHLTVTTVANSRLAYAGIFGDVIMEPGLVEVSVGSSSSDMRSRAQFNVTGKAKIIKGKDRAFLSVARVVP